MPKSLSIVRLALITVLVVTAVVVVAYGSHVLSQWSDQQNQADRATEPEKVPDGSTHFRGYAFGGTEEMPDGSVREVWHLPVERAMELTVAGLAADPTPPQTRPSDGR